MSWLQRWRESTVKRPGRRLVGWLRELVYAAIGMLTTVVVRLVSGSRPVSSSAAPTRIILVRPDRIGDLVLALPAFQALREHFPSAWMTAVVTPRTAPLLAAHPAVDACVCVQGDRVMDLWHSRAALRQLRQMHAELAIGFQPSWACGLATYLTRAKQRVGWDARGAGGFFTRRLPYRSARVKTHEIDANLQLVAGLGCAASSRIPRLAATPSARQWVDRWWKEQHWPTTGVWVMMHPGSRSAYTRWPPERFAQLVDRLQGLADTHVALLEGPGESLLIARVQSQLRVPPARVVRGLALPELMALLERMRLFIGNATGTTHLAAYLGPRVIEIIGGTHPLDCPERWGVLGAQHRIVRPKADDIPASAMNAWVGPEGLARISVEDVWAAVHDVMPARPA